MINSNNPAQRRPIQRPIKPSSRLKWLRSASVLAAASAMIAGGMPALAQAGPQGGASPHVRMPQAQMPQGASDMRLPVQPPAPVRIVNVRPINPTIVTTRALPGSPTAPSVKTNTVAPNVRAQMSINPAPAGPSSFVTTTPAPATSRTFASVPSSPSPLAAASANGVSVNATANFDDTQVRYTGGAAGDTVNILGTSAIIDWTTFDAGGGAPVSFLDANRNLFFTSDAGDYTVLNRITTPGTDTAIRIDGNVRSTILGSGIIGGNVWFSSAGGIILGSSSSFNIGSLLLTTADVNPADVVAGASAINFLRTNNPASTIEIQSGAQINALNNNSYVAMVAPRITQNGTVTVNGSVAYVAAEEATLTIQNNLFDISVGVGTEDEQGIVHGGTTTGPSSTGVTDEQAMYFVAVPKNNALTMLLSGDIGYEQASAANVVNGNIILTTGSRVERDERNERVNNATVEVSFNTVDTTVDGGGAGSIDLASLNLTSDTTVFAEDTINARAFSSLDGGDRDIIVGSAANEADLTLIGGQEVNISVSEVALIDVSGSLNVRAGDGMGNGGDINLSVSFADGFSSPDGGTLTVGNNLNLDASAVGLDDNGNVRNNGGTGIGGRAIGGDVSVLVTPSAGIDVGGSFDINTSASGGSGEIQHGEAVAGSASLDLDDGFLSVGGTLAFNSAGQRAGLFGLAPPQSQQGSNSTAGDVSITLSGGGANLGGLRVSSRAQASNGENSALAQSNDAIGAQFSLDIQGGAHSIGSLVVDTGTFAAKSFDAAGNRTNGNTERGGVTINVASFDTQVDVAGSVSIDAITRGGVAAPVGDTVAITVTDTGTGSSAGLNIGGSLSIEVGAGEGAPGDLTQAGNINITADNAQLTAGNFFFDADAGNEFLDPAEASDRFQGGDIAITSTNGGVISAGFSQISADGTGLADPDNPASGVGIGGTVTLLADNGTIAFDSTVDLDANGFATPGPGTGDQSGEGIGGTITITVRGADGSLSFTDLDAGTDGTFAFDGEVLTTEFQGSGSQGTGGLTQFNVLGGTLTADDITVSSDGEGGPGGEFANGTVNIANGLQNTGDGGDGAGGEVVFNLNGGSATVASLEVTSNGIGGIGAPGDFDEGTNSGDGGNAIGGSATFNAISGSLTVTDTLVVEATGNSDSRGRNRGGQGGFASASIGGIGGDAAGGSAIFNLDGTATVTAPEVLVSTRAFGGNGGESRATSSGDLPDQGGGDGGNAIGGSALFNDTAGNLTFGILTVNASGRGGLGAESSEGFSRNDPQANGGTGGDGTGGTARVSLNQDDATPKTYAVLAEGTGGVGGDGAVSGGGGSGTGGIAELAVNNVAVVFETLTIGAGASGALAGEVTGRETTGGGRGGDADGGDALLLITGEDANFGVNTALSITAGAVGANGSLGSLSTDESRASGNGGNGGDAMGGSATIAVENNANITIDTTNFTLNADSVGGDGANGQDQLMAVEAGSGGAGGDATGGVVAITAANGGAVQLTGGAGPVVLSSTGTGGAGGNGGDGFGPNNRGGAGIGGSGTGGSPTLSANGGAIFGGDVTLNAAGQGGAGGQPGQDLFNLVDTLNGQGGAGIGGSPTIAISGTDPATIDFSNVIINATGESGSGFPPGPTSGGIVTISDTATDFDGLLTFGSLTVDATGGAGGDTGLISIFSNSDAIGVLGNLDLDVSGDIEIALEGNGQLLVNPFNNVANNATLTATRNITISHENPQMVSSAIEVGRNFTATAEGGAFDASDLGDILASGTVTITALDIAYNNITSPSTVSLTATDGSITGTSTGTIIASAVNDAINLTATQNVTFGILNNVDGDPNTRDGNIDVDAGGDITGVSAISGQFIALDAGGLISVGSVDTSETSIGLVTVNGGAIDIGTLNARFISNLTSTTGDISIDSVDGLTDLRLESAAAIILGTAATGDFDADAVTDVTIGSLTTTGVADIGISAGGTVTYTNLDSDRLLGISAVDIVGGDILAAAGITLEAESIDIGDTRSTGGFVGLTSTVGDISAGAITSDTFGVTVDSAAAADLGDLTSQSTTRVEALGDVIVGDIDANGSTVIDSGGNLTAGDLFSGTNSPGMTLTAAGDADIASATANGLLTVNVDGALTGGTFVGQGSSSLVRLTAGSVDIDSAQSINQSVFVTATSGDAIVGNAVSGVNTTITGENVTLNSGDVGAGLTLNATDGSLIGTGVITVEGAIDLDATQDVTFGSLTATGSFTADAGGDITFDTISSTDSLVRIIAENAVNVGTFSASLNSSITGASVNLGNADVDLSLSIASTAGDITSDGTLRASNLTFNAVGGDVDLATTITPNSTTIVAGGAIAFDSVTASNLSANAGTDLTAGEITATSSFGDSIRLTAGNALTLSNVAAPGIARLNAASINASNLDISHIQADASGSITLDNLNTTINSTITGGSVALNDVTGDLAFNVTSTTGNISSTGTLSAVRLDFDSASDIILGDATTISAMVFDAVGAISFGSLSASNLNLDAGTTLTGDTLTATSGFGGSMVLSAGTSVDIGQITAPGLVQLTAPTAQIDVLDASSLATDVIGLLSLGSTTLTLNNTITAGSLVLGDVTNDLTLNLVATTGDIVSTGTIDSGNLNADAANIELATVQTGTANITAVQSASVAEINSTQSATINGAIVNIDSGDIGTNLDVTSSTGDITGLGSITVGNAATFDAARDIAIGILEAGSIALTSARDVRFNGLTSPAAISLSAVNGTIGATTPGLGDIDSGGDVNLTAQAIDMGDITSDGSITANTSVGNASFGALDAGTTITIDAVGNPELDSVTSGGDVSITGASIGLDGGDVGGNLLLEALDGDITLALDGTDQLLVAGSATFIADLGGMDVTHTNNTADTLSVDVGNSIGINLGRSFTSGEGSVLSTPGQISIIASDDISADDLRVGSGIELIAGGDVTLNDASASGPATTNVTGIVIEAGNLDPFSTPFFNPGADATITGNVTSFDDISITAGRNVIFASGSNTAADNALNVATGDDIILEAGATISSANAANPSADSDLSLDAGGIAGILASTPASPIASIILDGTINANDSDISLIANAIEGLDSTLIAGSVEVDVRDAPDVGVILSDDDGLLTGVCLEGIICLGDMDVEQSIEIGQNSNNDAIQLFIEQAEITATDIFITTRNDIVMGTNGIDTDINATGTFSAESTTGNVDLRDATIGADQIQILAAGSVLGTGVLTSANDIGITVGDSIIVGGIDTAGDLTTVENIGGGPGFYSVNGSFIAGRFSQGASAIDLSAGGDIAIGDASSPSDVILSANGDVSLDFSDVSGDIILDGSNVDYGSLSGNNISISGGGVTGGGASGGSVNIDGGFVGIGDVFAGSDASITGGSVAVRDVVANDITIDSASDIFFDSLTSTNTIDLSATDGSIADNGGSGDIVTDGDVRLEALDIAIGNVTALGSVTADATDGDASFGVVDAGLDITITATGSPSVFNAISGGDTSITGSFVTLNNGSIGGDLTLLATTNDIDGNGTIDVGGAIDLVAPGDITFGDLTSDGGSFVADAGGDLAFSSATSTDFLDLTAGGAVIGGDLTAANTAQVVAATITVQDVVAGDIDLTSDADIFFDSLQSPNAITVTAADGTIGANTLGRGDIDSDASVALVAEAVAINSIDAGGNVDVTATDGGVSVLEGTASGGNFTVTATQAASLGASSDADGFVNVTASQIDFGALSAGSTIDMVAQTFITGSTLSAVTSVDLVAGADGGGGTSGGSGGPVVIGGNASMGEITLGTLTTADADLLALGGPVTVSDAIIGNLLVAEGSSVDITSSTSLTAEAIANDGDVAITSQGTLEAVVAQATGDVTLESANGDLVVNDAQGQNISLTAAGGVEIEGIADAVSDLSIDAGGVFDAVNGSALGETISVLSGDVALGDDSIIGSAARTASIAFETFGDMAIGGDSNDLNPYQIDNSELSRITSGGDLSFTAFSTGSGPDALITLSDLDVGAGFGFGAAGQNFDQTGTLSFTSIGDIEVLGNVNVTGALADTAVSFDAANLIRLDTANGGIFIADTDGDLAGNLSIFATDFVAATAAAFADIDGLSIAAIDTRLGNSDGVNRGEGVIRADALTIQTTASDVFIQNTAPGTDFDDRRGFEVNSLSISTGGSTAQPIVINGIVAGETGIDAIAVTNIAGTPAVDSTINGCVIADPASCSPTTAPPPAPPAPPPPPPPPTAGPAPTPTPPLEPASSEGGEVETRDLIDDGLEPPDVRPEGPLQGGLIDLTPEAQFDDDPLIDDPVTGAGNEDFWIDESEECEEGESCS